MRLKIKYIDSERERILHIVDSNTGRGLILQYCDEWDSVRFNSNFQNKLNGYAEREIPPEEFETLYGQVSSDPHKVLFNMLGEFDPKKFPVLKSLLEDGFTLDSLMGLLQKPKK